MRLLNGSDKSNVSRYLVVVLLATVFLSDTVFAQVEDVVRVDTGLVLVPVSVWNRDGRSFTSAKKVDFQIFENGVEQEIAVFESIEEPLTVLMLLDVSGSMFNDISGLMGATSAFLGQLRSDDQVMMVTFNETVDVLFDFKKVKDIQTDRKLRIKLNGLPPVTMVYDAVEFGINKMKKVRGRKAIVLYSDGEGSGFRASVKSNIRDAEENEAPIYTVQFNTLVIPRNYKLTEKDIERIKRNKEIAGRYMSELAVVSGGQHFQTENITNLPHTFRAVADDLRRQYLIGYYPKRAGKDGERRQIKVQVKVPNVAVRARSEYVYRSDRNR